MLNRNTQTMLNLYRRQPMNHGDHYYQDGRLINTVIHKELKGDPEQTVLLLYYEGEAGAERHVKTIHPNKSAVYFEGEAYSEHAVRLETDSTAFSTSKVFFEGEAGCERLVKRQYSSGGNMFYEGEPGSERKVRGVTSCGHVILFEGSAGRERQVSMKTDHGTCFYEGEKGNERQVRFETLSGERHIFEGETHATMRLVRKEEPNGDVQYFGGERNKERLQYIAHWNGSTVFFEGKRGKEKLVRSTMSDGTTRFFEGEQHAERLVREETSTGMLRLYKGEVGSEEVVQELQVQLVDSMLKELEELRKRKRAPWPEDCPICMEPNTTPTVFAQTCGHALCESCAQQLTNRCSVCRKTLCGPSMRVYL